MRISGAESPSLVEAAGGSGGQNLGKEEFLELLVAQLGNQDPLNPLDDKAFIAQLAEFSGLEQMMAVNEQLSLLQVSQAAMANAQMAGLVGQNVRAASSSLSLDGASAPPVSFRLDAAADAVTVKILDAQGNTVRTLEVGPLGPGTQQIPWDGRDDAGTPLPAGDYRIEIEAVGPSGAAVNVTPEIAGVVTAVVFDRGYAELLIDGVRVRPGDVVAIGEEPATQNAP